MSEEDHELRTLMLDYQRGSIEAFQFIYTRLAPGLRGYLRHLVRGGNSADDLLQETFFQMHRSRAAYNPEYAVKPWVFGLARNVFLMKRRATKRWNAIHDTRGELPDFPVPAAVERLGSADEIRLGLANLPSAQAETLLLHHEWGFTFDEIAGMLGVSAAAARARASRGMAALRDAMSNLPRIRT